MTPMWFTFYLGLGYYKYRDMGKAILFAGAVGAGYVVTDSLVRKVYTV